MKAFKRFLATLLTFACLASVFSVFPCATDAEEPEEVPAPSVMLGYDYNHDVWLMVKAYGVYEEQYKSISLCRINENGEREIIENYTYREWEIEGEKYWQINELSYFTGGFMFPSDKTLFSQGNSYCLYFSEAESFTDYDGKVITPPETVQIDFTYDDLFEGKPYFSNSSSLVFEEESSVDMREYILFPVEKDADLNSENKYAVQKDGSEYFYDEYTITLREYDKHNSYVNMFDICICDKETGEEYDKAKIRVVEKEPDNFKELIAFTFEKLSEGIFGTAENIGWSVASSIFGMFLPVIFAVALIVAPFISLFS